MASSGKCAWIASRSAEGCRRGHSHWTRLFPIFWVRLLALWKLSRSLVGFVCNEHRDVGPRGRFKPARNDDSHPVKKKCTLSAVFPIYGNSTWYREPVSGAGEVEQQLGHVEEKEQLRRSRQTNKNRQFWKRTATVHVLYIPGHRFGCFWIK